MLHISYIYFSKQFYLKDRIRGCRSLSLSGSLRGLLFCAVFSFSILAVYYCERALREKEKRKTYGLMGIISSSISLIAFFMFFEDVTGLILVLAAIGLFLVIFFGLIWPIQKRALERGHADRSVSLLICPWIRMQPAMLYRRVIDDIYVFARVYLLSFLYGFLCNCM